MIVGAWCSNHCRRDAMILGPEVCCNRSWVRWGVQFKDVTVWTGHRMNKKEWVSQIELDKMIFGINNEFWKRVNCFQHIGIVLWSGKKLIGWADAGTDGKDETSFLVRSFIWTMLLFKESASDNNGWFGLCWYLEGEISNIMNGWILTGLIEIEEIEFGLLSSWRRN